MRRLVCAVVISVMLLILYPLVSIGIIAPWPAGYFLLGGEIALSGIAVYSVLKEERRR